MSTLWYSILTDCIGFRRILEEEDTDVIPIFMAALELFISKYENAYTSVSNNVQTSILNSAMHKNKNTNVKILHSTVTKSIQKAREIQRNLSYLIIRFLLPTYTRHQFYIS